MHNVVAECISVDQKIRQHNAKKSAAHRDLRRLFKGAVRAIIFINRVRRLTSKHPGSVEYDIESRENEEKSPIFVPKLFKLDGALYQLNFVQRLFVTFEYYDSSIISQIIFWSIVLAILLGVVVFILAADPQYSITPTTCDNPACDNDLILCRGRVVCEPISPTSFDQVDEACVILFTIDYLTRLISCWFVPAPLLGISLDPNRPAPRTYRLVFSYLTKVMNLIDICAILPYYIGLGLAGGGSSSSFVRILRLARLLRILKLGKNNKMVGILAAAMFQSVPALMLTIFFVGLGTVTFASIFYIIEQGDFKVSKSYPEGAYMRTNLLGNGEEKSPFLSIPVSIYFTIITQTTVGYGDIYPTTQGGRALACILAYTGILVLALPISVVGSNFSNEYAKYVEQLKVEKEAEDARKAAAQIAKRSGRTSRRSGRGSAISGKQREMSRDDASDVDDFRSHSLSFAIDIDEEPVVHPSEESEEKEVITDDQSQQEQQQQQVQQEQQQGTSLISETRLDAVVKQCEKALTKHEEASMRRNLSSNKSVKRNVGSKFGSGKNSRKAALLKHLSLPLFAPGHFVFNREPIKREYDISILGRIFMTIEDGASSLVSEILSVLMLLVIVLSVVSYIMSTINPQFEQQPSTCANPVCQNDADLCPGATICEPQPLNVFDGLDTATVAIFTVEYLSRVLLCWTVPPRLAGLVSESWDSEEEISAIEENRLPLDDPEPFTWYYQLFRYMTTLNSMIDFVAIVPFYISLGLQGGVSLSFVRVLRLARVLRLLKLMKGNEYIGLISSTMSQSKPALAIMCFLVLLAIIFFGSIIYIAEQGTFQVSESYPDGAYLRDNLVGSALEESPYRSIAVGIYWAAVTTTTLGYGDIVPTTVAGRAIACVAAYIGVLILALPIGVIGGNFMIEYEKMIKRRDEQRAKDEAKLLAEELAELGRAAESAPDYVDPYKLLQDILDCYENTTATTNEDEMIPYKSSSRSIN